MRGPGAGKSTTAAGVFTLLKLHEIESELITEFAKDLVWEERHRTLENQTYVFAKQQHRLWRVHDKVKVTITDCPLLLSNIYGAIYNRACDKFYDHVINEYKQYNNLNFFIERTKPYFSNGRNENETQAKHIDAYIKNYLEKHKFEYSIIKGNPDGINKVIDVVFDVLDLGNKKYNIS
jgi:nicotinamide riboside kinase